MCDGFKKVQILQTRIILGVPLFQETSMFSFVIRSDFHFEGHPQVISMPAGVCVCVSLGRTPSQRVPRQQHNLWKALRKRFLAVAINPAWGVEEGQSTVYQTPGAAKTSAPGTPCMSGDMFGSLMLFVIHFWDTKFSYENHGVSGLWLVQKSSEYSSSFLKPGDFTGPGSFGFRWPQLRKGGTAKLRQQAEADLKEVPRFWVGEIHIQNGASWC